MVKKFKNDEILPKKKQQAHNITSVLLRFLCILVANKGVNMRLFPYFFLLGTSLLLVTAPARPQETAETSVQVIRYDSLKSEVLKNRGKVVLVDFWATH